MKKQDKDIYTRSLPSSIEFEETVLGAMMLDRNAIELIIDLLRPETFYLEANQYVFMAIESLVKKRSAVDILTVTEELRVMGVLELIGGAYYITRLTNRVSSAAHVENHTAVLTQKYLHREVIEAMNELLRQAYGDVDVFELIDKLYRRLEAIQNDNIKKQGTTSAQLSDKVLAKMKAASEQHGLTGVTTGITKLDELTGGWQKTDLIILAARPGMGKTAWIVSNALAAAEAGMRVTIFSLEMGEIPVGMRFFSAESKLPYDQIKKNDIGTWNQQQFDTAVARFSKRPIIVDDTPALSIFEMKAKCRRQKPDIVFVDYLQLMRSGEKGLIREQEIAFISKNLKVLAKDFDIPVVALAQLSREVEKTTDKRPLLSHLRESGSLEQDADVVTFLYRPEYYNFTQDAEGNDLTGIAEAIVAKHRNGTTDTVKCKFLPEISTFKDLEKTEPFSMQEYNPAINVNAHIEPIRNDDEGVPF